MRRIVVYTLLSLDGVAESPEVFVTTWDDLLDANLAEVIGTQDAVVLGRRSHDEWAAYWPTSDVEPFATFINGVAKYVVTSTPLTQDWPHTTVLDGDPAEALRALQREPGGDIGVHASISLARSLLVSGVVDELRLVVAPRIAGGGRRFLEDLPEIGLDLLASTSTPTGALLLRYRVEPPAAD
ncbi:dihydrofolate reductase family protein [Jatrophihabitans sp. YIM 134969]